MSQLPFNNSLAIVIGIDNYSHGISPLQTAVNDSVALADLLEKHHGYEVIRLLNEEATNSSITKLLSEYLPGVLRKTDRLLFYFAGHGVSVESDDGPAGYLIPQDGQRDNVETFLEMKALNQMLMALPCDHCLILLDSCFSGAFRWSTSMRRSMVVPEAQIYRERFDRFVSDPAWQVITSTSYDQTAMDVLSDGRGLGTTGKHSPFAEALLDGLKGEADSSGGRDKGKVVGDGVITAQELAIYLRDRVEPQVGDFRSHYQTPELWPLKRHDKGQYVFLVPGHKLNLPSAEKLTEETNPYRGLQSYDEEHSDLFYGRNELIEDLKARVTDQPLTVVLGHSGTGKSSLVKAGLVPKLRQATEAVWTILPPFRSGREPLQALAKALLTLQCEDIQSLGTTETICEALTQRPIQLRNWLQQWEQQNPAQKLLIVVDQFEELITLCDDASRQQFLTILPYLIGGSCSRIVLTLRSDFESQFSEADLTSFQPIREQWIRARFFVTPMTQDELRQAIEEPASQKVMYFEPHKLVDDIINEVVQMPGALPLLSFTLSELYRKYLVSGRNNRAMELAEYEALGGVSGALTKRATEEYTHLCKEDKAFEQTVKHVMLRMVSLQGGELARRRVPLSELVYADKDKNEQVQRIINQLATARLLIRGQEEEAEPYVEPAHDALVSGWQLLQQWRNEEAENLELRRLLTPSAMEWQRKQKEKKAHGLLWNNNPRLPLLREYLKAESSWLNQREEEFIAKSEQQRKSERRRVISFLSLVIVVLSGISLYATRTAISERNARQAESQARQDATARRLKAEAQLEGERPGGSLNLSMLLALEALKRWPESELPDFESILSKASLIPKTLATMEHGVKENLNLTEKVTISSDNRLIASAGWDNTTRLWDINTGQELFQGLHTAAVRDVAFSPNNNFIASISDDNTIRIWDIKKESEVLQMRHDSNSVYKHLKYSLDGKYLASSGEDNAVILWDSQSGEELRRTRYTAESAEILFSKDGKYLVSASRDGTICILELNQLNQENCTDFKTPLQNIDLISDQNVVAFSTQGEDVVIWDFQNKKSLFKIQNSVNTLAIAFSPNGKYLAYGREDGLVRILDSKTGQEKLQLTLDEPIKEIQFDPNSEYLLSRGDDKIQGWDIETGKEIFRTFQKYSTASISVSTDNLKLVSSYFNGEIRIQEVPNTHRKNIADSERFHQIIKYSQNIEGAILNRNGTYVAIVTQDEDSFQNTVYVWDVLKEEEIFSFSTSKDVNGIIFSDSGKRLAINLLEDRNERSFEIWDISNKENLFSMNVGGSLIDPVIFGPDDNIVIFSENPTDIFSENPTETTLHALNLDSGKKIQKGEMHPIIDIALSPDASLIAIAEINSNPDANTVKILETKSGNILRSFPDARLSMDIDFSHDGKWLAAAYGFDEEEGSVKIWNTYGEKQSDFSTFLTDDNPAYSLDFSHDDKSLVVGWSSGSINLFDIETWDDPNGTIQSARYEDAIRHTSFSPDKRWLIHKTSQGLIYLIDLLNGNVAGRQQVKNNKHTADTAFSEVGPIFIDVSGKSVIISSLLGTDPLNVCQRLDRNLTLEEWARYLPGEKYSKTCENLPLPELPTQENGTSEQLPNR